MFGDDRADDRAVAPGLVLSQQHGELLQKSGLSVGHRVEGSWLAVFLENRSENGDNSWLCCSARRQPGSSLPGSKERAMARVCQVTGKAPMVGNNVSHANNRTKRRFLPNLQQRRFWVENESRWISLRLTNAALRTIDKKGIDVVLAELRANGERV